jgi:aconitate hydratase
MAIALSGRLDFDPTCDYIAAPDGTKVYFTAPHGEVFPAAGYERGSVTYVAPPDNRGGVGVTINPASDRLQVLEPFPAWNRRDYMRLPILMKARGKCTTDHISAAGKWLTYRGHLENISGNLFAGVVNDFNGSVGEGKDALDGATRPYPEVAKRYGEAGVAWCAIGDRNYGEGSSREHAAMEPRFRGGVALFARSFARIHETNQKKQGLLPLTFSDPETYDSIEEDDCVNILSLPPVPGRTVRCQLVKPDGILIDFEADHTFSEEQIKWFEAGSALNCVRDAVVSE